MSRAAQAAMAASYKSLKEDFVSNLTGGEISEINYVTAVAPAAVILWSALQSRQLFFKKYGPIPFAIDFLLNVSAILLATTVYAANPIILNLLILAPVGPYYMLPSPPQPKKIKVPPTKQAKPEPRNPLPKKPFLTTYRGAMMVVTCLAILAVDFRIFPRRFAKVENWGTSLMDVGVGSFVFSAGVVAARPILKEQLAIRLYSVKGLDYAEHVTEYGVHWNSSTLGERLYASIRHSVPLLVLGFIRLYSVKGLDYAEHVTEYGVHWNFFFTLGFLPPFLALFQSLFKFIPSYAGLAILLGVAYQLALEFTSLKAFILTAPRTNLFDKNREGIFSFFGYLSIFLAGQNTGLFVLPHSLAATSTSTSTQQRKRLILTLAAWSGVYTLLFNLSTSYSYGLSLAVSRRLANLPYFLWIAAFNCTQITAFCVIETVFFPAVYKHTAASDKEEEEIYRFSTSRVLDAYNRNGLAIFLAANLLTGLVNLTIPTLHVNHWEAMGILVSYAGVLTGLAVGLDAWDISIKM